MSKYRMVWAFALLFMFAWAAQAQTETPAAPEPGPTLNTIQQRGQLICGVNEDVYGFGFLNPNTGDITGLYVDFCKALAVATLGDAIAADLRLLDADAPLSQLEDGALDVVFAHGVHQRLTSNPILDFGPPVFYDGFSVMVLADSEIVDWPDLAGETVCALRDSLAQAAFEVEMANRGLAYSLLPIENRSQLREAFTSGRCDVVTMERSLLEIMRSSTDTPTAYRVWTTPFTRQEQSPIFLYGDKQWRDIVHWTIWGMIEAEAMGIHQENLADYLRLPGETDEVYIERIGIEAAQLVDPVLGLGGNVGLAPDFMAHVIRQVGNYGEVYADNFGPQSKLPIDRALNQLWTENGLLTAPYWE
jgi:general L-amino acid transport system substrate-binding protein